MKKRTLCSMALLAVLGASIALPAAANAEGGDAKKLSGKGSIEYVEDTDGGNEDRDSENPDDKVDPPYIPNTDKGSLMIDGVSDMNFKQQKAVLTDQNYFAEQVEITKNGAKEKRGVYLQFTDRRIDNRSKWELRAKMSQQFEAASGNKLANSTINFTNPIMETATDPAVSPHAEPGKDYANFTLEESGNTAEVLKTTDAKNGVGTYTVGFGNTVEYHTRTGKGTSVDSTGTPAGTGDKANEIKDGSITLFVPGKTVKTNEAYEAKVLWEIVVIP
ncbi:WxL domain-containing protein [Candidatus Enterococcus mansonii]|uniref:WxL domain-containing protein n=1 Tax=Candidatus Enterococcus mansonii TaxID=1834181 RepID=A0A242CIX0_9ENTE|nr:WxL domain-containing protein [Enterococcus sp. 4G2_DIV0659]OTO10151.1 hypothetical protein A5880_000834 [Enterococcus sp. 4G2_DIV0659]